MSTRSKFLKKYDKPVPRYTSYPTVPMWQNNWSSPSWLNHLENAEISEGVDLYVHIPFCHQLCWYCGCNRVVSKKESLYQDYLEGLKREWQIYTRKYPDIRIKSLHFGGGTPNSITTGQFENFIRELEPFFLPNFIGSSELDPRLLSEDFMRVLAHFNFQRVSFGIQDFDKVVQEKINRVQPFELVKEKTNLVRKKGIKSLNYDLIYGLPSQTNKSIEKTLEHIKELRPDLLALYSYAHLPEVLKNQKLIDEASLATGIDKNELYMVAREGLKQIGYVEIGLDHFSLPSSYLGKAYFSGRLKRSFMGYTDEKSDILIGLGVTAISSTAHGYFQNGKSISEYLNSMKQGFLFQQRSHLLSENESRTSKVISKLMCYGFVSLEELGELTHISLESDTLASLQRDELIVIQSNSLIVTDQGRPYIRNIASVFDESFCGDKNSLKRYSTTA